jgi:SH3 domain-containing YSC84-like protein 1
MTCRKRGHMLKKMFGCCAALLVASSAFAELSKDEVKRFQESAAILTELRTSPDKGIPEELWKHSECVMVIPSMKKAAFVVGGEYGSGVMSCRNANGNGWSAPIFMQLAKGSWGLQIGAEQVDLVLLVQNRRGVKKLLEDKVSLGADASVAAGPVGRSAHAATDAQLKAEMLSYSRSQGLFAGIDLSGGMLHPDKEADVRAYGSGISARQVIDGSAQVHAPAAARVFLDSLADTVSAKTR